MEFYKDNNFNQMAVGCPVEQADYRALYKVKYSVKRHWSDPWMWTESHASIASFETAEARATWVEWHKANTPDFVFIKEWKEMTKEEMEALHQKHLDNMKRAEIERAARARKREHWQGVAVARAIKSKS